MLIGSLSCVSPVEFKRYKKYLQEIETVIWSPDGSMLIFKYINYRDKQGDGSFAENKYSAYSFDLISKKINKINNFGLGCCLYENETLHFAYVKQENNGSHYFIYESDLNGIEKKIATPINFNFTLGLVEKEFVINYETISNKKNLIKLNRKDQSITTITLDKTAQDFLIKENIQEYEIKHLYKKNKQIRVVIEGKNKLKEADIDAPSLVTYASGLIENNQITQIEKIDQINADKEEIHFFGLQSENQLVYAKNPRNQPPLTYYEYNFSTHGRSIRSEMNKINQLINDGRYIVPLAFSPNFKEMVYIVAINTDQERNPIRDFIHFNLSTGEKKSLFNIYETLPKGDFKYGL